MSEEELARLEADLRERLAKLDLPKPKINLWDEPWIWGVVTFIICLAGLATVAILYFASGAGQ